MLTWFFRRVATSALAAELRAVEPGWIVAAAAAQVAALACRGVRWRALLSRRARVPLGAALSATYMGWVVLALAPARLGELARPWLVARRHALDRSFALGAQLLERLLDVGALVALLALFLTGGPAAAEKGSPAPLLAALERAQTALLVALLVAIAALVAAVAAAPWLERAFADRLAGGRWAWLGGRGRAFASGLTTIRSARALGVAGGQTVVLWLLVCSGHLCLFRAFSLDLPALAVGPLLVFVVAGAAVPTPAGIGSYHAAVQLALGSLLGVPVATASAYALVSHAAAYLPNLAIGAALLLRRAVAAGLPPAEAPAQRLRE